MGWGFGINEGGREVGYTVSATCDEVNCMAAIDRGLAYACGDMHDGGEYGCGMYYCGDHLLLGGPVQLCKRCQGEHARLVFEQCDSDKCAIHADAKEDMQAFCEECPKCGGDFNSFPQCCGYEDYDPWKSVRCNDCIAQAEEINRRE